MVNTHHHDRATANGAPERDAPVTAAGGDGGASIPKLLLTAGEAAEALRISEKTLWSHSKPRGSIPVVRIGAPPKADKPDRRRVLYDPRDLVAWIDRQKDRGDDDSVAGDSEERPA